MGDLWRCCRETKALIDQEDAPVHAWPRPCSPSRPVCGPVGPLPRAVLDQLLPLGHVLAQVLGHVQQDLAHLHLPDVVVAAVDLKGGGATQSHRWEEVGETLGEEDGVVGS